MVSRGEAESSKLQENIQNQLNRLLTQLNDLEELKEELTPEEYEEMKAETIQQVQAFEEQMEQMKSGDMTLVDQINKAQLAIRNATSQHSNSAAVIEQFAAREPEKLREQLAEMETNFRLQRIDEATFKQKKCEILSTIKKLGADLTYEENDFVIGYTIGGSLEKATAEEVAEVVKHKIVGDAKQGLNFFGAALGKK